MSYEFFVVHKFEVKLILGPIDKYRINYLNLINNVFILKYSDYSIKSYSVLEIFDYSEFIVNEPTSKFSEFLYRSSENFKYACKSINFLVVFVFLQINEL